MLFHSIYNSKCYKVAFSYNIINYIIKLISHYLLILILFELIVFSFVCFGLLCTNYSNENIRLLPHLFSLGLDGVVLNDKYLFIYIDCIVQIDGNIKLIVSQ